MVTDLLFEILLLGWAWVGERVEGKMVRRMDTGHLGRLPGVNPHIMF